jgi:hypothetical protein
MQDKIRHKIIRVVTKIQEKYAILSVLIEWHIVCLYFYNVLQCYNLNKWGRINMLYRTMANGL